MMLRFTKAQTAKLHRNWQAMQDARATGAAFDPEPVVKAFSPDASATWLIAAMDPDQHTGFGVCDLGLGFVEVGEIDMAELRALRGRLGLPVERDRWFRPDKSLWGYHRDGQVRGRLVT